MTSPAEAHRNGWQSPHQKKPKGSDCFCMGFGWVVGLTCVWKIRTTALRTRKGCSSRRTLYGDPRHFYTGMFDNGAPLVGFVVGTSMVSVNSPGFVILTSSVRTTHRCTCFPQTRGIPDIQIRRAPLCITELFQFAVERNLPAFPFGLSVQHQRRLAGGLDVGQFDHHRVSPGSVIQQALSGNQGKMKAIFFLFKHGALFPVPIRYIPPPAHYAQARSFRYRRSLQLSRSQIPAALFVPNPSAWSGTHRPCLRPCSW